jgi:hypothetical protein
MLSCKVRVAWKSISKNTLSFCQPILPQSHHQATVSQSEVGLHQRFAITERQLNSNTQFLPKMANGHANIKHSHPLVKPTHSMKVVDSQNSKNGTKDAVKRKNTNHILIVIEKETKREPANQVSSLH